MIGIDEEYQPPGWMVGGYMDDSLTDDQVARVERTLRDLDGTIEATRFIEWLRSELANYRNLKVIASGEPGSARNRTSADRMAAMIGTLLRDLDRMSPDLASRVDTGLLKQGARPQAIFGALVALQLALLGSGFELSDLPAPSRGRKTNTLRDQLLAKVTSELLAVRVPKSKAPTVAAEVMTICGVATPHDGRPRPEKRTGKN